jgi:hypothetical protein
MRVSSGVARHSVGVARVAAQSDTRSRQTRARGLSAIMVAAPEAIELRRTMIYLRTHHDDEPIPSLHAGRGPSSARHAGRQRERPLHP